MGDDDLEDARRRWGGDVAAVHTFAPVREGAECPVAFGDIVHLKGGTVGVVRLPDQGAGLCTVLMLEGGPGDHTFPDRPEVVITTWDRVLRVIGSRRELPHQIRQELEPYHRGVVLGGSHWDVGVRFFHGDEYESFRSGRWSDLGIGTQQLAERHFGTFDACMVAAEDAAHRVLVHTDEHWNSWHCLGPMSAARAAETIDGLGERFDPPVEIRRGVFAVSGATMSKWEHYLRCEKIDERHLCRGQGE